MKTEEKFKKYAELLRDWSTRVNLVAPSTLGDIETRHIADSAQLAEFIPNDVAVIDLGSGAGFPAAVLAIIGESHRGNGKGGWDVTAIESVGKKTAFLNAVKDELDLPNFTVFNGRVEDFIRRNKLNPTKFVFTARAFAPLIKILDYVAVTKCRLFLLKGREIEAEVATAKQKYSFDYKLTPSKTGDGFIICIDKLRIKN